MAGYSKVLIDAFITWLNLYYFAWQILGIIPDSTVIDQAIPCLELMDHLDRGTLLGV